MGIPSVKATNTVLLDNQLLGAKVFEKFSSKADPQNRVRERIINSSLQRFRGLLVASNDNRQLKQWFKALQSPSDNVRGRAVYEISKCKDSFLKKNAESLLPVLIQRLEDPSFLVRSYVAYTLEKMGNKARGALSALLQALRNSSDNDATRLPLVKAIGVIGYNSRDAVNELISVLQRNDSTYRVAVLTILGGMQILQQRVLNALLPYQNDADPKVRLAYISAVERLKKRLKMQSSQRLAKEKKLNPNIEKFRIHAENTIVNSNIARQSATSGDWPKARKNKVIASLNLRLMKKHYRLLITSEKRASKRAFKNAQSAFNEMSSIFAESLNRKNKKTLIKKNAIVKKIARISPPIQTLSVRPQELKASPLMGGAGIQRRETVVVRPPVIRGKINIIKKDNRMVGKIVKTTVVVGGIAGTAIFLFKGISGGIIATASAPFAIGVGLLIGGIGFGIYSGYNYIKGKGKK